MPAIVMQDVFFTGRVRFVDLRVRHFFCEPASGSMAACLLRIRARSRGRGHSHAPGTLLPGLSGTPAEMADPGGCTHRRAGRTTSTPQNLEKALPCRPAGPDYCSAGCNLEWSRTSASEGETTQISITCHTYRNDEGTSRDGNPVRSPLPS